MEKSSQNGHQDRSWFGPFVQPEQEEVRQRSSYSQAAARDYLQDGGRPSDELAMYKASSVGGGNRHHFQWFPNGGVHLHEEEALASTFEGMNLRTDLPYNSAPVNGYYLPGRGDFTVNQPCLPAYASNEKLAEEVAFGGRDLAYGLPPHYDGDFSRSYDHPVCNSIFSIPYRNPSSSNASTSSSFQQRYYVDDGQSPVYSPYDQQPVGSSFNMGAQPASVMQPYSVLQPHYNAYPQAQQQRGSGLDFARNRRGNQQASAFTHANCAPNYPYFGVPEFHGIENGDRYLNGAAASQRSNGRLKSAFEGRFPKNTDRSRGSRDFRLFRQQDNDSFDLEWRKPQFLSKFASEPAMEPPQLTYNSVDEVAGRMCAMAKDENGCSFLQDVFTKGTREDAEKVLAEIIDHIAELMVDPSAQDLVQKILDECSDDQRMRIICEITKVPADLLKVCCNMHGTRVVQKVIESVNTPEQALKVVSALSPGALRLMTDPNGCHVVYQCLQSLLPEHKAFLLDTAASRHLQLGRDRHGCCVLQRCIAMSSDDQKNNLLNIITSSALRLSEDQYGNYVIQYILTLKIEWATAKIVDELQGHFGYLSVQKCGSHVVEQCLRVKPQMLRDRIINELMNDPRLPRIMLDQYGNYVIQTALSESKGAQHSAFVEAIRPYISMLQCNMFGKKVLQKANLKIRPYHPIMF